MNTTQIKKILSDNGYSTDANVKLDLAKFMCIFLDQEQNLYTDSKRTRFAFNYTDRYVEVYSGRTKNNTFIYDNENIPNDIFTFDAIVGFVRTARLVNGVPMPFIGF